METPGGGWQGDPHSQPSFWFSEMNRHHYALYVHNCRLVFLLRKDFDQADTFRPAEFHWKLDQVRRRGSPALAGQRVGASGLWSLAGLWKRQLREARGVSESWWKLPRVPVTGCFPAKPRGAALPTCLLSVPCAELWESAAPISRSRL